MNFMEYALDPNNKEETKNQGPYLRVENLKTQFFTSKGIVKAIDNLSFEVQTGEIMGLVGESGCGKSVTATSIMDLIPDPPGRIIAGHIHVEGFDILGDLERLVDINVKSETNVILKRHKRYIKRHNFLINNIRGRKMAMIFQEPFLALNPLLKIGDQISESIMLHNQIQMGEAIIRRETISEREIDEFMAEVSEYRDLNERDRFINRWARLYGVPDSEQDVREVLNNNVDPVVIRKDLIQIFRAQIQSLDIEAVRKVVEFNSLKEKVFSLNLQLLESEKERAAQRIDSIESELRPLEREFRSQQFRFTFMRIFSKKKYVTPFVTEARKRALELLQLVNIAGADRVIDSYPHELSGGMQQRSMIAMALASNPKLLIADEPTTALDVTTQAQILRLLKDLREFLGSSIIFITHDLAVIAEMCDRVGVMYAGNLIEEASVADVFKAPLHPYTIGLLQAIPRADRPREETSKLQSIPGTVPNLIKPPSGCRFHPRCEFRMDICSERKPRLVTVNPGHKVACFLFSNEVEEVEPRK